MPAPSIRARQPPSASRSTATRSPTSPAEPGGAEAAAIHEGYVDALRSIFHAGGVFYFTWVIPALAFLAVITPFLLRLRISLPARRRSIVTAAAILIVGGAVGMEMLAGGYVDVHGYKTLTYSLLANLEETMALVVQVLLVYGLLLIVRDEPERA